MQFGDYVLVRQASTEPVDSEDKINRCLASPRSPRRGPVHTASPGVEGQALDVNMNVTLSRVTLQRQAGENAELALSSNELGHGKRRQIHHRRIHEVLTLWKARISSHPAFI